jgi:SpoVK/Ycf46/Vps4 family AAA+-type ATPase
MVAGGLVLVTKGESLRKLLLAHFQGDAAAFRSAAEECIQEERRKNHHLLARDLDRILSANNGSQVAKDDTRFTVLSTDRKGLPRDQERDVALVEIREPRRLLSELVLDRATRSTLERIVEENRRADVLRAHGVKPSTRILFCGPPGCGKSVSAEAIAAELYLPLVTVRFDAVVSSYLGETAANLRRVFEFARSRPMVVLFDEFDAIGKDRASAEEHGEIKRVVNSFLQILDGFRSETLTIAATNHEGLLDTALWRRFDEIVYFDRPEQEAITELLLSNLRQIGIDDSDLPSTALSMIRLSHADIERICRDAIKTKLLTKPGPIDSALLREMLDRQRRRVAISAAKHSERPQRPSGKSPRIARQRKRR